MAPAISVPLIRVLLIALFSLASAIPAAPIVDDVRKWAVRHVHYREAALQPKLRSSEPNYDVKDMSDEEEEEADDEDYDHDENTDSGVASFSNASAFDHPEDAARFHTWWDAKVAQSKVSAQSGRKSGFPYDADMAYHANCFKYYCEKLAVRHHADGSKSVTGYKPMNKCMNGRAEKGAIHPNRDYDGQTSQEVCAHSIVPRGGGYKVCMVQAANGVSSLEGLGVKCKVATLGSMHGPSGVFCGNIRKHVCPKSDAYPGTCSAAEREAYCSHAPTAELVPVETETAAASAAAAPPLPPNWHGSIHVSCAVEGETCNGDYAYRSRGGITCCVEPLTCSSDMKCHALADTDPSHALDDAKPPPLSWSPPPPPWGGFPQAHVSPPPPFKGSGTRR